MQIARCGGDVVVTERDLQQGSCAMMNRLQVQCHDGATDRQPQAAVFQSRRLVQAVAKSVRGTAVFSARSNSVSGGA